jgi:hypothetical protein
MQDLDDLGRSLPQPWWWNIRWLRALVIQLDEGLPRWLRPKSWC